MRCINQYPCADRQDNEVVNKKEALIALYNQYNYQEIIATISQYSTQERTEMRYYLKAETTITQYAVEWRGLVLSSLQVCAIILVLLQILGAEILKTELNILKKHLSIVLSIVAIGYFILIAFLHVRMQTLQHYAGGYTYLLEIIEDSGNALETPTKAE